MKKYKPFIDDGKVFWGEIGGIDAEIIISNHALQQAKVRYLYEAVILDILFIWTIENGLGQPSKIQGQL